MQDEFEKILEEMDESPVKTTKGKKLTTTACVNEIVKAITSIVTDIKADEITEAILPTIKERIEKEVGIIPKRIEVVTPQAKVVLNSVTHEKFKDILQMVQLDIPVYLTGKAGTGKNVICQQIAKAMNLDFYFTNAVTQEYKLTGFIDANGKYHKTQFYEAFTKGGLFFLDEMDASVPETLIVLNAAIANRYFDFPVGRVKANPNFRVIAAGNTLGTGADRNYTGRYSLDRASLDRFAMVEIDYCKEIEESITGSNTDLVKFAHEFRKAADKSNIECLCTYRALSVISKLESVGTDMKTVFETALLKGLDADSRNILRRELEKNVEITGNKYYNAFCKTTA